MVEAKTIVLYVLGKKGYLVLKAFVEYFGVGCVNYVVCARDQGVIEDYFDATRNFCSAWDIDFYKKNSTSCPVLTENSYVFCVGWRWMVDTVAQVIVFHDSPLPRYRGFAPLVNMLINGESEIGVTALLGADEYDKGNIISQKIVEVKYPIKILDAIETLIPLYVDLVFDVFSKIKGGRLSTTPQDDSKATYSPWRDHEDYFIDWADSSDRIKRFCDALGAPYDGAKARVRGEVCRIFEASVEQDVKVEDRKRHIGKILFFTEGCPVVICGQGLIRICSLEFQRNSKIKQPLSFRTRFE